MQFEDKFGLIDCDFFICRLDGIGGLHVLDVVIAMVTG